MQTAITYLPSISNSFERESLEIFQAYYPQIRAYPMQTQRREIQKIAELSTAGMARSPRWALKRAQLLNSLDELARLEEGWDGCGAYPISASAIESTATFLRNLPEGLALPDISPNPNGTISLHWAARKHVIELEIGRTQFAWAALSLSDALPTFCSGQNRVLSNPSAILDVAALVAPQEDLSLIPLGMTMSPIRMESAWEEIHLL